MRLLVDAGNSRIKWGLHDGHTLYDRGAYFYRDSTLAERIPVIFETLTSSINSIWISNVAGNTMQIALCDFFQKYFHQTPHFPLACSESFGLTNGYSDPKSMGMDRWFALIAAWHRLQKPLLLVGVGTCTTIDMVDASGQHCGSLIAPGLCLLQESIVHRVENCQIPIQIDVPAWLLGNSTSSAIHSGCISLVHSFVQHAYQYAKNQIGNACASFITGGDAPLLLSQLSVPFEHTPHLVLEGLALHAHIENTSSN